MVKIRLKRKLVAGYYVVTSPDIKGLHVAVRSLDALNSELDHALRFALKLQKYPHELDPSMLEYTEIA